MVFILGSNSNGHAIQLIFIRALRICISFRPFSGTCTPEYGHPTICTPPRQKTKLFPYD